MHRAVSPAALSRLRWVCVAAGVCLVPLAERGSFAAAVPEPEPPRNATISFVSPVVPTDGVLVYWYGSGTIASALKAEVHAVDAPTQLIAGTFEAIDDTDSRGWRFVPQSEWQPGAHVVTLSHASPVFYSEEVAGSSDPPVVNVSEFEVVLSDGLPESLSVDGSFTRQVNNLDVWCCSDRLEGEQVGPCTPTQIEEVQLFRPNAETFVDEGGNTVGFDHAEVSQYLWRARTSSEEEPPAEAPGLAQLARFLNAPAPGTPYEYQLEGRSLSGGEDVSLRIVVLSEPESPPARTPVDTDDNLRLNRCSAPPEALVDRWCDVNAARCADAELPECAAYAPLCLGLAPSPSTGPVPVDLGLLPE